LEHIIAQLPFRDKAALAGTCTLLRIAALDCLAQISELDVTGLGRFRINAACDFAAKYCKNLTSILAGYSNLNDDTLAALVVANPQLTQLRVPGCRFLGRKGLESVVQHCSSIQWLDIQGCTGIDKNTLRMLLVITCSKSLEVLNLSGTQVDDGCLELLSARCLRSLNLDWERGLNSSVSSCGLQALATRARQHKASPQSSQPDADRIPHLPLQELSLAHRKAFDNNGLACVASTFTQLERLEIKLTSVDAANVVSLIADTPLANSIRYLGLAGIASSLEDEDLRGLGGVQSLEELDISCHDRVTDSGLLHLRQCARLRCLSLARNARITVRGICALVRGCGALEHVRVFRMARAGEGAIRAMLRAHPDLSERVTFETDNLTFAAPPPPGGHARSPQGRT